MTLDTPLLVQGTHATGADCDLLGVAIAGHGNRLEIGMPHAVRPPLGETDITTELRTLVAQLASCH